MNSNPGCLVLVSLLWSVASTAGALYSEGERGPHHKVWNRITQRESAGGPMISSTNSYIQLTTGLHYWEDNQWKNSREEIEILDGAAVARKGQHQVIFSANLNTAGAIDMLTPDGKRLRSHPLGIAYTDAAGQSVLIAQVKDCAGALLPPNQVFYLDAFEGDCVADVRYTYRLGSFEQDVILRQAPPSPAEWGLDPASTRLEVWTEFIEAPQPAIKQVWLQTDLIDQHLDFGVMQVPSGSAFALGADDPFADTVAPTAKSWQAVDGRLFLIEMVQYSRILPYLQTLPQAAALDRAQNREIPGQGQRLLARAFPPPPRGTRGVWKDQQFARLAPDRPGLVLDYLTVNGSLTNYVFKGDTTYFVTNTVSLYGTSVLEGGCVVKLQYNGSLSMLEFNGPVDCRTSPWHPAIFTAKDDDSVGDVIQGSTGSPSGTYGYHAVGCKGGSTVSYDWHDLHIRYANRAVGMYGGTRATFSHVQIGNSSYAFSSFSGCDATCRNVLIYDTTYAFHRTVTSNTNRAEHATLHRVPYFSNSSSFQIPLTNSLLISVTNNVNWMGSNVETNLNDSGIFQTVGAGAHYLATNSPYRNAGTTDINLALLAELAKRTTYPPILLTNDVLVDTLLGPQVSRDTEAPDLGYHYDPLDYIARSITVSNSIVTVTNSATLGIDFNGTNYGILLDSGAKIVSRGLADGLNRFVRVHAVQELPASSGDYYAIFRDKDGVSSPPQVHMHFTDFPLLAGSFAWEEDDGASSLTNLVLQDCQVRGGHLWWGAGVSNAFVGLTNNVFDRVQLLLNPTVPGTFQLWNNLLREGAITIGSSTAASRFKDNHFHLASILTGNVTNEYNGYITNATRLTPNSTNDVILTNTPVFQMWLSRDFYYPTNDGMLSTLIDKGSRYASNAGLYHFTVFTNQTKEAGTKVEIGFHYVALTNSAPIDTDGDGIADYLEDANGNGSVDSGETDWQSGSDQGLGVSITRPRAGSLIP